MRIFVVNVSLDDEAGGGFDGRSRGSDGTFEGGAVRLMVSGGEDFEGASEIGGGEEVVKGEEDLDGRGGAVGRRVINRTHLECYRFLAGRQSEVG